MQSKPHIPSQLPEPCSEWLDACLASLGSGSVGPGPFAEHLCGCQACAAARARYQVQALQLGDLQRLAAPSELDRSLKVALTSGGRQDRALAALRSLPRLEAPLVLDQKLAEAWSDTCVESSVVSAPAALDARVDQSLRVLAAERALVQPAGDMTGIDSEVQGTQPVGRHWKWSVVGIVAAATLMVLATNPWMGGKEPGYSFTVVHGGDGNPLQAHQLAMLASVTGRQCSFQEGGSR
jgi:hypothetical protein